MANTHVYQFDPQFTTGTVKGVDGSGNNAAGIDLVLTGGNSTGAGAGGDLVFKTAPAVVVNPLAAQFVSASSQSLSRADNTDLSTGNVDWWASGWVWFDTVGINDNILTKYDQNISADREFHFATSTSSFFAMAYQTTAGGFLVTATAFGAPSVSTWYYWLVWNDATNKTINVRLNNGTVFSTTYTGTGQDGTAPFRLGATVRNGAPEAFLNGRLDEVSFGKNPPGGVAGVISTISSTLYNSGSGLLFSDTDASQKTAWGAVSAWNLDEASGTRADSVGSNTLTANNAPANNTGKVIPMGTSANTLTERARITTAGKTGFGTASPTAAVHLKAGTAAAGTAPLKLTAGTSLTAAEPGAVEYDGNKLWMTNASLARESLTGCLFTQTADQTVTNTVSETSIVGTGVGTATLPANFFVAGKTVRIRIGGVYSTPALGASLVVKVKLGSTAIASVTTTSLLGGASSLEFDGEAIVTCRTTGASGTVAVHGDIEYSITTAGGIALDSLNNGGATATVDTTTSKLFDVTVTWDTNTASRIVKSTVCSLEALN